MKQKNKEEMIYELTHTWASVQRNAALGGMQRYPGWPDRVTYTVTQHADDRPDSIYNM